MNTTLKTGMVIVGVLVLALSLTACNSGYGKHYSHYGNKMFDKMDKNADGKITKSEFISKSEKHFATMDLNSDGEITKKEAKKQRSFIKKKCKH